MKGATQGASKSLFTISHWECRQGRSLSKLNVCKQEKKVSPVHHTEPCMDSNSNFSLHVVQTTPLKCFALEVPKPQGWGEMHWRHGLG